MILACDIAVQDVFGSVDYGLIALKQGQSCTGRVEERPSGGKVLFLVKGYIFDLQPFLPRSPGQNTTGANNNHHVTTLITEPAFTMENLYWNRFENMARRVMMGQCDRKDLEEAYERWCSEFDRTQSDEPMGKRERHYLLLETLGEVSES